MSLRITTISLVLFIAACSSTTQSAKSADGKASAAAVAATQPDTAKLVQHLEDHVQYPATRADVLAACANTSEFTEGEKKWTAEHLPEGQYASAEDAARALGI